MVEVLQQTCFKRRVEAPTRLRMATPHVSSSIMFSKSPRKCVSSLGFQKVHHWFMWNGLSSSKPDVKTKTGPFRGTRIPRSEPSASKGGPAPSPHPAGLRGCVHVLESLAAVRSHVHPRTHSQPSGRPAQPRPHD